MLNVFHRQASVPVFQGLPGVDLLRLVLLSLAAVIAITLGIDLLFEANTPNDTAAPSTAVASVAPYEPLRASRQKIMTQIDEAPDYARFFDRMKTVLPIEYDAVLDKFAKQARAGADVNIDSLVSEAVRDIRLSSGILAAKADGPALAHIFDMQLQMMQALAGKDPRLCVDFLYGGASEAFFQFSAQNRRLVADMAIAGLDAIDNGRASQIERPPPSDADFSELETAMKAQGLNSAEIAAILDGKTPDPPIADERMCTVGQIYLKTLATLPEPERLRIYGLAVELMARS